VGHVLDELIQYANYHFRDEEKVMETIGFPRVEFERHKRLHEAFTKELGRLMNEPLWVVLDFIQNWLLGHILAEDMRIGRFLRDSSRHLQG